MSLIQGRKDVDATNERVEERMRREGKRREEEWLKEGRAGRGEGGG